ncbi:gluconokinase [Gilvimarinus sp. F26214L]|uniref:gluconokinase n=1 Tax=Gilvimarinus sp. DZF01 TaxID=3461371 RepID=UPI004046078D
MTILVIMGVSGSGKTTLGQKLADYFRWPFYEGDRMHPRSNVEKMSRGVPLTDDDRQPWLAAVRGLIEEKIARGRSAVLTCSALKQSYRDYLAAGIEDTVTFVYLKAPFDLLHERIVQRRGHYMPAGLLASQFEILEEPRDAITVDASQDPDSAFQQLVAQLTRAGIVRG